MPLIITTTGGGPGIVTNVDRSVSERPYLTSTPFLTIQEARIRPPGPPYVPNWEWGNIPGHCTIDVTLSIEGGPPLQDLVANGTSVDVGTYVCIATDPEQLSAFSKNIYPDTGTGPGSLQELIAAAPTQVGVPSGPGPGLVVDGATVRVPTLQPWTAVGDLNSLGFHIYQLNFMTTLQANNYFPPRWSLGFNTDQGFASSPGTVASSLLIKSNFVPPGTTGAAGNLAVLAKMISFTMENVHIPGLSTQLNHGLYLMAVCWQRTTNNTISIKNVAKQTLLEPGGKVPLTLQSYTLAETDLRYGRIGTIWPGSVHEFNPQKYIDKARDLGSSMENSFPIAWNHGGSTWQHPHGTGTTPGGAGSSTVLLAGNRHQPPPSAQGSNLGTDLGSNAPLTATTVPNIKIIDSRMLDYLQKRQDQVLGRRWLDGTLVTPPPAGITLTTSPVYFSALEISKMGASDVINGMFSFDAAKFMADNNRVGNVISNPESLANAIDLQNIEIYQKLTGPSVSSNELTHGKPRGCGLTDIASFKKVASLENGCYIVDGLAGRPVLDVIFRDLGTAGRTSGNVEYMVEVTVSDRTVEILRELIDTMKRDLRVVEDAQWTGHGGTCMPLPIEFPRLIQRYLGALSYLAGPSIFGVWGADYINAALMALIYDSCDNRFAVAGLISSFITSLEAVALPTSSLANPGSDEELASRLTNSNNDPILRLKKKFTEKLIIGATSDDPNTTDTPILVGYGPHIGELLAPDPGPGPGSGVRTGWASLKFDQYSALIQEMVGMYPVPNAFTNPGVNPYGYLSPVYFYTGTNGNAAYSPLYAATFSPESGLNVGTVEDYNTYIASSLNPDNSQNSGVVMNSSPSQAQIDLLRFAGIGIQRLHTSPAESAGLQMLTVGDSIAVEDLLSPESAQVNTSTGYDPNLGLRDPLDNIDDATTALAQGPYVLALVNGVAGGYPPGGPTADWAIRRSMQYPTYLLGSLMQLFSGEFFNNQFHQSDPEFRFWYSAGDPLDPFELKMKYGSVAQVQYLAQYDDTLGLGQQNWRLLDTDAYDDAKTNRHTLLCRLVFVGGPVTTNLSVRPMSTLFIISPTNNVPTVTHLSSTDPSVLAERERLGLGSATTIVENMSLTDNTTISSLITSLNSLTSYVQDDTGFPQFDIMETITRTVLWYAQDIPSIDNVTEEDVAMETQIIAASYAQEGTTPDPPLDPAMTGYSIPFGNLLSQRY